MHHRFTCAHTINKSSSVPVSTVYLLALFSCHSLTSLGNWPFLRTPVDFVLFSSFGLLYSGSHIIQQIIDNIKFRRTYIKIDCWAFGWDSVESLDQFRESWHLNIEAPNPWTYLFGSLSSPQYFEVFSIHDINIVCQIYP